MRYLRWVARWARIAPLTLTGWLIIHGVAVAQGAKTNADAEQQINSGTYVFAYFVVILATALGVLAVCLSGRRRDRVRPEQYTEAKVIVQEEE